MTFASTRSRVLALCAIAVGVAAAYVLVAGRGAEPLPTRPAWSLASQPLAPTENAVTERTEGSTPRALASATAGADERAPPAQRAALPDPAIDVVASAPRQVAHGETFTVSVGVPPALAARSGVLRVAYDTYLLEPIDVIDPAGTALPPVMSGDGEIEIELHDMRALPAAPAVRFLARTDAPRYAWIDVTAELADGAGEAIAARTFDPSPILLLP